MAAEEPQAFMLEHSRVLVDFGEHVRGELIAIADSPRLAFLGSRAGGERI